MLISIFEIPLIRDIICQSLSPWDLQSCVLVCQDWNISFSPYLWQTICVFRKHIHKKLISSKLQETLRRHSCFTQSLTTYYAQIFQISQSHRQQSSSVFVPIEQPIGSPYSFNNLTTLKALALNKPQNYENNCRFIWPLLDFIEYCPRLRVLVLGFFKYKAYLVSRLADVVKNHPSLKDLSLCTFGHSIRCIDMNLLLQSCCRLDRLEIECRIYMGQYANWIPNEQDLAIEPLKLPESELKDLNIKHFDVYWAEEATLLPLLAQCPNLKSLALPDVFSYHDTGICQAIGNHIHSLKQLDLGGTERDDANICSIIEACAGVTPNPATTAIRDRPWEDGFGGLEIFNGGSCGLALKSISALIWGHRMTLRKIEIDYCVRVSNKMLEVILRSCPNLLVLQATMFYMSEQERNSYSPNLEVQAMRSKVLSLRNRHEGYAIKADDSSVDHGPVLELEQGWVSKKLTFLSISYKETEDEAIPEVLFHQIAQLKSLETLVLVCHSTTATTTTTNSLDSLPTGLSALLDINDERGDIHDSVEEKAVAIQKQQQAKMLEQNKRRNIKEALEMFKNELSNLRRFELCGLESYIDPFKWPI